MPSTLLRASALLAGAWLALAPAARGADSLPAEKVKELKAASVLVKFQAGPVKGTGSGFVFKIESDAVYVATNQHVVEDALPLDDRIASPTSPRPGRPTAGRPAPPPAGGKVEVVFDSGTNGERTVTAEVLAADEEYDLAVLRVRGVTDPPKPIDLTPPKSLVETTPVWVFGFPFGESLATGGRNPAISVGTASVSSLRLDEAGKMETVQLNGAVNPGNSGGPVLTADGRLVGITVATIKGSGLGFAVPYQRLDEVLRGRLGGARVRSAPAAGGGSAMRITVDVADPFKKAKSGSLKVHVLRTDAQAANPVKPVSGKWPTIPNAAKLTLTPAAHGLTASTVTPYTGTVEAVWTQTEWERTDGTVVRGAPTKHSRPTTRTVVVPDDIAGGTPLPNPGASAGLPRPSPPPFVPPSPPRPSFPPSAPPAPVTPPDPTVVPNQAWDLPPNLVGGVAMLDLVRFPERYANGAPVTVYGYLSPSTRARSGRIEAQVQAENRVKLEGLEFDLPRDLSVQLSAEPRKIGIPRYWPVRFTVAQVPFTPALGRPAGTVVYDVREIGFLDTSGQVAKTLKDSAAPTTPPPAAAVNPVATTTPPPARTPAPAARTDSPAETRPPTMTAAETPAAPAAEKKGGSAVGVVLAILGAVVGLAILGGAVTLLILQSRGGDSGRRDRWTDDRPRPRRDDYDRRDGRRDDRPRGDYDRRRDDDYERRPRARRRD